MQFSFSIVRCLVQDFFIVVYHHTIFVEFEGAKWLNCKIWKFDHNVDVSKFLGFVFASSRYFKIHQSELLYWRHLYQFSIWLVSSNLSSRCISFILFRIGYFFSTAVSFSCQQYASIDLHSSTFIRYIHVGFSVYLHLYLSSKVLCCTVCTAGMQRIHSNRNINSVSFSKSINFNASRPNYSSEALTNYQVRNILPHVRRVQRFGRPFSKTNPIHFNTSCRVVACTGLSFVVLACCKRRHENLWVKRIILWNINLIIEWTM